MKFHKYFKEKNMIDLNITSAEVKYNSKKNIQCGDFEVESWNI